MERWGIRSEHWSVDHVGYTSRKTSCISFFVYRRRAEEDAWDWMLSNDLGEAQVSGYKRYRADWSLDLCLMSFSPCWRGGRVTLVLEHWFKAARSLLMTSKLKTDFLGVKSRPQNKQGWFLSIINGTFIQIDINLKFAQMQSVSIFPSFAHSFPFLAFLCFFSVFRQFLAVVIFKFFLWPGCEIQNRATTNHARASWISVELMRQPSRIINMSSEFGKTWARREEPSGFRDILLFDCVFSSKATTLYFNKIKNFISSLSLRIQFDIAYIVDFYSVADQAWQLLKLYLNRLGPRDGHVYYRCVSSKLLSAGAALPTWLVNDYKVRRHSPTNNSRKLIILFVVIF